VIERHDNHHQSAQQINRKNARGTDSRNQGPGSDGNRGRGGAHIFTPVVQEISKTFLFNSSSERKIDVGNWDLYPVLAGESA
jgi:hypothetical protein